MSAGRSTYEEVRGLVEALPASEGDRRLVRWVGDEEVAGAARAPDGRLEIFLAGPPLVAADVKVGEALTHEMWEGEFGPIGANRLALPQDEHFQRVAAFLLTEFLQLGVEQDLQRAFREAEPLLSLLFDEAEVRQSWLFGLAGELLCLNALLEEAHPAEADRILYAWKGSGRSARDIQLGEAGIEVKTTSGLNSRHKIQGFHQIEPGASVGDAVETSLFLWSIGLRWQDEGEGYSIDALTSRIAAASATEAASSEFLRNVDRYGSAPGDQVSGAGRSARERRRPLQVVFARLYDTGDPAFVPLRSSDLVHCDHTPSDSVSFDVQLPVQVSYPRNPVGTLRLGARYALTRAGLALRAD